MEAWQTLEHLVIRCGLAVILLSVWTWRANRPTRFRGKQARNIAEEFKAYGLSKRTMYGVGFMKVMISLCFLGGHWAPFLIRPAAILLSLLMCSAVVFHLKVERDSLLKTAPAYIVFFFACYLALK